MKKISVKKSRVLITNIIVPKFQEINARIENINNGGCGVFAESAFNMLSELGLKPKLVIIALDSVKSLTKSCVSNKASFSYTPFHHIVIQINGKYLDSKGLYNNLSETEHYKSGFGVVKGLPIDLLSEWNKEEFGWNPKFDREKNVEKIEDELFYVKEKIKEIINKGLELSI